ncbi:MAG: hypothetical protein ACREGB_05675 [Candidatus Saccharimonadales bacterium]
MNKKQKTENTVPKQYFTNVSRKLVYGCLAVFFVIALALFLCVPHYKPLQLASTQQIMDAHRDIIHTYFLSETTCKDDSVDHTTRVKTFNKYFRVNQYANRAVLRGCNNADVMLAKDDAGKWQKTDVNIVLSSRQNPQWQKACLIDDITPADTKVRPENNAIDAFNLQLCNQLAKQSYIEVNLSLGIHFHF